MFDTFPDFVFMSFGLRLLYFAVGLVFVIGFLRWLDRSIGITFKSDVWNKIHEDPQALAIYHGLRFLAVLWFAGRFLS